MLLHVKQECIIQTVHTRTKGNRKPDLRNDLICNIQLRGTVAVTLTHTHTSWTVSSSSAFMHVDAAWVPRMNDWGGPRCLVSFVSGGWAVFSLSWNWHAFYMLCDPALMFDEHQPVFHVQVSTAGITHIHTHTQGSCCRLTAGCCCCCWVCLGFFGFFFDKRAPVSNYGTR